MNRLSTREGWRPPLAAALLAAALLAGPGAPAAALPDDGAAWWRHARAMRSELLAMLVAAERDDRTAVTQHVRQAAAAYTHLTAAVAAAAPASDRRIRTGLDTLHGLPDGALTHRALVRGRVLGELAAAARLGAIAAARAGDPAGAEAWLALREYRKATPVTLVHSAASRAVQDQAADLLAPEAAAAIVRDDLDDTYHARVRYAATDAMKAADHGLVIRPAESAGLIGAYLSMLGGDYTVKQGAAAWAELQATAGALEAAALAADGAAVREAADALLRQWRGYQAVELPAAELRRRANLLQLFLELVAVEYRDGVRNGAVSIEAEYREAVAFLEQAALTAAELAPRIAAVDAARADRLERLLDELARPESRPPPGLRGTR